MKDRKITDCFVVIIVLDNKPGIFIKQLFTKTATYHIHNHIPKSPVAHICINSSLFFIQGSGICGLDRGKSPCWIGSNEDIFPSSDGDSSDL